MTYEIITDLVCAAIIGVLYYRMQRKADIRHRGTASLIDTCMNENDLLLREFRKLDKRMSRVERSTKKSKQDNSSAPSQEQASTIHSTKRDKIGQFIIMGRMRETGVPAFAAIDNNNTLYWAEKGALAYRFPTEAIAESFSDSHILGNYNPKYVDGIFVSSL